MWVQGTDIALIMKYYLFISFLSQLLKRKTALKLFKTLHIERWAFDVEMLKVFVLKSVIVPTDINTQVAEMMNIPIGEIAVRWQEIDGSKLNPLLAAIQMFKDIFLLWLRYAIGAWKIPTKLE